MIVRSPQTGHSRGSSSSGISVTPVQSSLRIPAVRSKEPRLIEGQPHAVRPQLDRVAGFHAMVSQGRTKKEYCSPHASAPNPPQPGRLAGLAVHIGSYRPAPRFPRPWTGELSIQPVQFLVGKRSAFLGGSYSSRWSRNPGNLLVAFQKLDAMSRNRLAQPHNGRSVHFQTASRPVVSFDLFRNLGVSSIALALLQEPKP